MIEIRRIFPSLSAEARQTSPKDDCYNCIAWAAGDTDHHWWPTPVPTNGVYWPVEPEETQEGFVRAFRTLGYEPCGDGQLEEGIEKLVLYVDPQGVPTHMARQLESGKWSSKMGILLEDIEHPTPDELCGPAYGRIALFLARPKYR